MKILVISGPNLNLLDKRNRAIYGDKTLSKVEATLKKLGKGFGVEIVTFQSNSEGQIIDFIQANSSKAEGIIINPGALTHYGFSLRDALEDADLPIIEVHISNIYAREDWRAKSVIAPIAKGQISGLGLRGYVVALQTLVSDLKGETLE
jgi:3-dehydroquinate dehydratase-2